jgi:uncharacterized protein (DUF58 family)
MDGPAVTLKRHRINRIARHTLDRWIQRRARVLPPTTINYRQIFILPTRFGWMLGLLMFGMLMGSLNFNNNLGLMTTFIVAGLALISILTAYRNLRDIRIHRTSAEPVFAGQPLTLNITFINDQEQVRPALEMLIENNKVDFELLPTSLEEIGIRIATHKRGWLRPDRLCLQTSHPMGLFVGWTWFWPERPVLVWPRPATHPPPMPTGLDPEQGRQQRHEPDGEEFFSLRNWRGSDPLHRIAWKASQRHQVLLSREFRAEQSEHLTFDLARTPGRDLEERISNLTAWILQAEREHMHWTLKLGEVSHGPGAGQAHCHRCLRLLAELE